MATEPSPAPDSTSTVINGLNDQGRMVGFVVDANGNTVGLIATPATNTGKVTLTFDDLSKIGKPLNGEYPTGLVDWGQNAYGWDTNFDNISFEFAVLH